MGLRDVVERAIGTLWGKVSPEAPAPPPKQLDARQWAVKALLDHLSGLTFSIDNPPGPPKAFRIPRDRWLDEWPDNPQNLLFPTIAAEPGEVQEIARGLTNELDETSKDKFGDGTALLVLHEHQERIVLEVWASTRFERAAIVAGLEGAFDPAQEMSGMRLPLPDYYDQAARYTLERVDRVDDDDAGKRRRKTRLTVRLEVDVVRLVRVREFVGIVAEVELELPRTRSEPPTS